jgi:hypothetical protein
MFKCGYGAVGNCSMANSAVLPVLSTVRGTSELKNYLYHNIAPSLFIEC